MKSRIQSQCEGCMDGCSDRRFSSSAMSKAALIAYLEGRLHFMKLNVVAAACALLAAGVAHSAEVEKVESEASSEGPDAAKENELEMLAKIAQNPVANVVSVPFQNNTNFGYGPPNNKGTQNVLNIQPVVPITLTGHWNLITRTIIPLISQPSFTAGGSASFGLSDISFTAFLSPANPGKLVWGVGPVATFPTATSVNVGSQSTWGLGPSAVLLTMPGHWVFGVLANNVWNIAGNSANNMLIQYFVNYNLPRGWYVTSSPIITANWNQPSGQQWVVPFGAGFGKLFKLGKLPINGSVSAYYDAVKPDIGPDWTLRVQFTILLPKQLLGL